MQSPVFFEHNTSSPCTVPLFYQLLRVRCFRGFWSHKTILFSHESLRTTTHYSSGPQTFWHRGPFSWKTIFPRMGPEGDGFGMIQEHYMYCALYFYYYYVSSTSDHQALDPGGWGPLLVNLG